MSSSIKEPNDVASQPTQLEAQKAKEKFYESNAGDGTTVYDQYLHGAPLILCLMSCFSTLFLIGLDQTIVITLLEAVGNKFNAYDKIGWISAGYMLTMCVFAATWGRIAITWGRKWSLLSALLLFEAGSLMCALSQDANVLIGGRVLAGVGGGGIQTLTFIVASEVTPIHQRSSVFALLGIAFTTSTVSGPLIGGAFTQNVTWRWCFYINLPVGGLAAALLILFFNPPKAKGTWKDKLKALDYVGTFFLTAGVVIFLLALTFGGVEYAWNSGAVISQFIIGGLLIICFIVWNFRYSKAPIIPLFVIKQLGVTIPVIAMFFVFYTFMSLAVYLSTYFQVVRGYNAWKTGVHLLPTVIASSICAISSGLLIKKTTRIKELGILGTTLGAIGAGLTLLLKSDSSNGEMIGFLILPGVYLGTSIQTSMMAAQVSAPKDAGGTILSTSLINFSRALGASIGADLSQAIFNASFKNKIKSQITKGMLKGVDPSEASKLVSTPNMIEKLPDSSKQIVIDTIMDSLKNVFIVATVSAALSVALNLFYSNKKVPKEADIAITREERAADEHAKLERKPEEGSIKEVTDVVDSSSGDGAQIKAGN